MEKNLIKVLKCGYFATRNELFPEYKTRGFVSQLKKEYNGKLLVGAEIGTDMGYHALMLLYHNNIDKLYLIDSYKTYANYEMKNEGNGNLGLYNNVSHHASFLFAKKLLKKYNDKIVFVKKKSIDAINDIPDNLDFSYHDANHKYNYIKKDIEIYYKKVRIGGLIGGHDFCSAYGVPYAVLEFAEENGILDKLDGSNIDWWIKK